MLESAAQYLTQSGQKFELVAFELSAFNVDKPPLSDDAILDRAAQFAGKFSCIFTNAPTFIMKARLHPNTTFILGYVRPTTNLGAAPRSAELIYLDIGHRYSLDHA